MKKPLDLKFARKVNDFLLLFGGISFSELLAILEEEDEDDEGNNGVLSQEEVSIAIPPPNNSTQELTDEESGDEDIVSANNLPGSQLGAEAELMNSTVATDSFQCIQKRNFNKCAARKNKLDDMSCEEMKCFIGILLLSGYVSVPRRSLYWEESSDMYNRIVSNSLSRDRFEFIMSNFHCCDSENLDVSDWFAKVRPLFTMLNDRFHAYAPHREKHSFDETMVPYFGRHGCKQFIREQYMPWTTRSFAICRHSFLLDDFPYHIFFDNFSITVPLLYELKKRRLKGTGTIRDKRNPKSPLETTACMKKNLRGKFRFKIYERQEHYYSKEA
ncbi:hypothetical protein PR048_027623 [Dryococelus australis]|uniref:PiggyBac transposable element-derived protein domain-containing protein n=1 Tax=Dryococelus australis TaxID=614101 RepID=A0ABQ9GGZ9_9NEOP|nr:hypothetical protein PR048_027623 [Dryococelus australis]